MPTVSVYKDQLFAAIGKHFTDDEFDMLCFEFGIELDEVTSEHEMVFKEKGEEAARGLSKEVQYKIDVPANRYDILCLEGIARALRIYLRMEGVTQYKIVTPKEPITMTVQPATAQIRPFVMCAVLRNVTFTPERYASFIDLQDKLHQNIGRRRTLIAIGTHDLDTLTPPFTYEALPRKEISFQPLSEERVFNGDELFHYYANEKENCHLKPYLYITENSPVQPVIYDSKRTVCSVPPIINGEHSKITLDTKNIFIECTGTDYTKLNIVLDIMVSMFAGYCATPFEIEACNVVDVHGKTHTYPNLKDTIFKADPDYINNGIGISMEPSRMAKILSRMQLPSTYDPASHTLCVSAPPTRPDILHAVDIMEDVAIAYGYNNIKKTVPKVYTVGKPQPLNALSDKIRGVVAEAGFLEVLTWVLGNYDENFKLLNRTEEDESCVTLANYKTEEFNIVRTSIIPGLLKTLSSNGGRVKLPMHIFELSDVCVRCPAKDKAEGARNVRRLGALYCGVTSSGFEVLHSLLDRVMLLNGAVFKHDLAKGETAKLVYEIKKSEEPAFFPGRRADIYLNGAKVGVFGVVHPTVLSNFNCPANPTSILELDIEPFL